MRGGVVSNHQSPYFPGTIPGCIAFLDSELSVASSVVNGGTVQTLTSQVSGGANATQATSGKRGIWNTGGLNGKSRVTLDGTKAYDWSLLNPVLGNFTAFSVYKLTGTDGNGHVIFAVKDQTNTKWNRHTIDLVLGGYTKTTIGAKLTASAILASGYSPTLGTTVGHADLWTYNNGTNTSTSSYTMMLDGATQTIIQSGNAAVTASNIGSLGGTIDVSGNITSGLKADWYCTVIYNQVITADNQLGLYRWANWRYGV